MASKWFQIHQSDRDVTWTMSVFLSRQITNIYKKLLSKIDFQRKEEKSKGRTWTYTYEKENFFSPQPLRVKNFFMLNKLIKQLKEKSQRGATEAPPPLRAF